MRFPDDDRWRMTELTPALHANTAAIPAPHWVTTIEQLQDCVAYLMQQEVIALDTEFLRTRTYYAIPGLIQLADTQRVYLIDPVVLSDLGALKPLMIAPRPLKLIHSMTEDVLLLEHILGVVPRPLYDTQVAASFLGEAGSQGFQAFVREQLGEELDKSETRSDWTLRPLSEEQIRYAVQDVVYLLRAYHKQHQQICEKGLLDSVMEECDSLLRQILQNEYETDLSYLKLRGAWELNRVQQRILKPLVRWRDEVARHKDKPKSWICDDQTLIRIAKQQADSIEQLRKVREIKDATIKRYGEVITECVQQVLDTEEPEDFQLVDKPISGRELIVYRELKLRVEQCANWHGLPVSLVGPKKQLEQLIFHYIRRKQDSLTSFFTGWREPVVGEVLLEHLRKHHWPQLQARSRPPRQQKD